MEKSANTKKINLEINKKSILDDEVIDKELDNEDTNIELTEEDVQHLLKSEEDIRMGRTHTLEEVIQELEEKCGFKYYKI